jgi:hypothetical protein
MDDEPQAPFTENDHRKAIILSALLGWTGVTAMELGGGTRSQILFYFPFFAGIGLPVAFLATWFIGGPIIRRIMRRPVGWLRAAAGGACVAAIIAAISIVIGRLNGLRIYHDPSYNFQLGGGDYVREVDGILTAYGWQIVAQNSLVFVAIGAVVGLLVRAVIGPGRIRAK